MEHCMPVIHRDRVDFNIPGHPKKRRIREKKKTSLRKIQNPRCLAHWVISRAATHAWLLGFVNTGSAGRNRGTKSVILLNILPLFWFPNQLFKLGVAKDERRSDLYLGIIYRCHFKGGAQISITSQSWHDGEVWSAHNTSCPLWLMAGACMAELWPLHTDVHTQW